MAGSSTANPTDQPVFYYDLGSPQCYVVGETIMSTLPVAPEWEPVLASQLGQQLGRDRDEVERLAAALGLQALRWPRSWPPDSAQAMLAATYAKKVGRGVAFCSDSTWITSLRTAAASK